MKKAINRWGIFSGSLLLAAVLLPACQSGKPAKPDTQPGTAVKPTPTATVSTTPAAKFTPIRIKAGGGSITDSAGNVWLADQGFDGGDTIERPDNQIANTKDAAIYRAERYSMTSFSQKVPNGKYQVKLHFAETYEGISGPGERVFSYNVEGKEFKDFDVFKTAGGANRAYVQNVDVEVKDGKLDITFTPNVENPEINGIEILPL
jgi:hypothetical protein